MKIYPSCIVLILMAYVCLAFKSNTKSLEIKSTKSNLYDIVKTIAKDIKHDFSSRSIAISALTSLLDVAKVKLKDLGTWIDSKEDSNTFIGRCFGVAKRLKVILPIILLKLGAIITILAFLTIFTLKTLGLVIFLSFVSGWTKIGLMGGKHSDESSYGNHPQNIHLHFQQNRKNHYSQDGYSIERATDSLNDRLDWYQRLNSNDINIPTAII
ncbi:hypothetical protein WA026_013321 [Henosepilachna vigintioctopunctata]|uniref:Uncharacterized protein n=1 Tax=Henosepilachna vigintioctopunctata TaxID=420089 RepID=A0AAW1VBX9_9CUCU